MPITLDGNTLTGTNGNDSFVYTDFGGVLTNHNPVYLLDGNDYGELGFGNDFADGGGGNDTIYGMWGADALAGELGADILYGGDGDDGLYGGADADALFGGLGHDTLDGGQQDGAWDNLAGGDGNDTYIIWETRDVITAEVAYASATSTDTVWLRMANFDMNATADHRAIENLLIEFAPGAVVNGNMLANTITGGAGSDSVRGDFGNDVILGGKGLDQLNGGLSNDRIDGGDDHDSIWGAAGLDSLMGAGGSDWIYGGDQADQIDGGLGGDLLYGGLGDDTLWGDKNLMVTGTGQDWLDGGDGNDRLYGGREYDSLSGGLGDDLLDGGEGSADGMAGGLGNDTYVVDHANDSVQEFANQGTDRVNFSLVNLVIGNHAQGHVESWVYQNMAFDISVMGSSNADVVTALGAASATMLGLAGNDALAGSQGNDRLDGGTDNDVLQGFGGADRLIGGAGNDWMYGGLGDDTYEVGAGDTVIELAGQGIDTLRIAAPGTFILGANIEHGTATNDQLGILAGNALDNTLTAGGFVGMSLRGLDGHDRLIGSSAREFLEGGNGNDTLTGNAGDDILMGGNGVDLMQGGTGNDTYYVDQAADVVSESIFANGTDTVRTSVNFALGETLENLVFLGGSGWVGVGNARANRIEGGSGGDTIRGEGGTDELIGRGGADRIWGGANADRFVFTNSAVNAARVMDFESDVDTLVLDADAGWFGSFVDADTTRFTSATGGTILVDGFELNDLNDDVLFV